MARLTTTSFAILGYLAMKPWPAYELNKQIREGSRLAWTRTEARLYQEPKNLVEHGLAEAEAEIKNGRKRTVYSITDKGRDALREWLGKPSAPPVHEFEALLKSGFAEFGNREDLLAVLAEAEEQAHQILRAGWEQFPLFLERVGAEPERLHNLLIYAKFVVGYSQLIVTWSKWARAEVEGRPTHWAADEAHAFLAGMRPDALTPPWLEP